MNHTPYTIEVRELFLKARQRGLRAKEAAESMGFTEGAALAAFAGMHLPILKALPVQTPLAVYPLKTQWLDILGALYACGPVMALTRNESTVHEKTGVYEKVSGSGAIGLVLGKQIDLRLFLGRWATGLLVIEPGGSSDLHAKTSLQFFDKHGVAVHKVFPVPQTDRDKWLELASAWVDTTLPIGFVPSNEPEVNPNFNRVENVEGLANDWAAMTDTHQFFGLLKKHNLGRLPALQAMEGKFTRQVGCSALRSALYQAAFSGLSIMVFVGNPGCIQIHTGPVKRIEPMDMHGKQWLNVLDPGFNLHLREDLIDQVWLVEKPTEDGMVSSMEIFDAQGNVMAMVFGERKPGQSERQGWKDLLADIPSLNRLEQTESTNA